MTDVQTDAVYGALRGVIDPELHLDIVELGMVRDVTVDGPHVDVSIALTIASCPLRSQIENDVRSKLLGVPGIDDVTIHTGAMTADEKADLMSRARLKAREDASPTMVPATTRVIAVSSGKGGVGKSTTSANLVCALAAQGFTVGALDADIWGFSLHRMLGADGRLSGSEGKIEPVVVAHDGCAPIKVISMGLLVDDEDTALMWRGLMLTKAVEQFLHDVRWGDMDYLVIDMPPGTGDVQMGLARMLPQAEMLLVTTPHPIAQRVAVRAASMARRSHMKVLGVVENMSGFTCAHGEHYDIFGSGGGEALATQLDVPLVAKVPLDPETVATADAGTPVVLSHPDSAGAAAVRTLATRVSGDLLPPVEMSGCTARLDDLLAQVAGGVDGQG
jgi:ATP-binding protein involved in chromosome partitioning